MKTITIVAKGPSAEAADDFIRKSPDTDVAVVNDAGVLLSDDQPIHYCVFTHASFFDRLKLFEKRVATFVSPKLVLHENTNSPVWMAPRLIQYDERYCAGDTDSLRDRVLSGGITHHNTVNGAIHFLVKAGYRRVRIIGVDGGSATSYATGVRPASKKMVDRLSMTSGPDYLDAWRNVTGRLLAVLKSMYGIEVEWRNGPDGY